jgi:2-polyprenyl-3-methyl-5-hydroxy-6-metoxy-1,4-benzoquinol methylase
MVGQGGERDFDNNDFGDINRATRPQVLVGQQDRLNSVGEVQAYKRRMAALPAPRPGDRLLDAGCGSGADVLALAPWPSWCAWRARAGASSSSSPTSGRSSTTIPTRP